jgi:transcriptional regulator with XRE-family HTH domain
LAKYPNAGTLFALNMQRVRREQEISQEKLAELAGLHRAYISSAEHEGRNVAIDNVEQIASVLKVEHYQLLVTTRT